MPDSFRRLRPYEAFERDVIASLTRPTVVGEFWVDLDALEQHLDAQRAAMTVGLTFTHYFVKAAALAVRDVPELRRIYGRWRVLEPSHVDVGISVEAPETMLAPVVIIEQADSKTLAEIARDLRSRARRARVESRRFQALANRYLRLLPFPPIRRALIRTVLANVRWRRRAVGSIQISTLDHFGIDSAHVPLAAELLLVAGAVERQARIEGRDKIVIRTGAQFTLHGTHAKVNGRTAGAFIERFRNLLAAPERLT
ncbi:MAG TPA: 2-oxo acid dehydrogenase subunit E2 [Vicinamibacterales bacterium]|nr:2-oxo acid dehydrogenase subunit E2 [Vicinamibacterales bacterium]